MPVIARQRHHRASAGKEPGHIQALVQPLRHPVEIRVVAGGQPVEQHFAWNRLGPGEADQLEAGTLRQFRELGGRENHELFGATHGTSFTPAR